MRDPVAGIPLLAVSDVSKSFSGTSVLDRVTFEAQEGEVVCLLGPSGCGKTTLLRVIAGLERADSGKVTLGGHDMAGVPTHRRGLGLMFQDYALFPHKDVMANVAFGLQMLGHSQQQIARRVAEMLELVGLSGYERRRVYDLSGGEQQRVALARSLAPGPRLLMLDEPLGSLDRALREELMNELRIILSRVAVTVVYVTHDQEEAFAIADRLIIMDRGRVVQQGTPLGVYQHPDSTWVARFLGLTNLVPAKVVATDPGSGSVSLPTTEVETPLGTIAVQAVAKQRQADAQQETAGQQEAAGQMPAGQPVTVLIRPEGARLASSCPGEDSLLLDGVVRECTFRGGHNRLVIGHHSGLVLVFELVAGAEDLPQARHRVSLAIRPGAISLLAEACPEGSDRIADG